MKIRLLLCIIYLYALSAVAQNNFGTFGTAAYVNSNGTRTFYNGSPTTGTNAIGPSTLQGASFGTFSQNSGSLKLDGVEVKTFKNGSGNVCSATMFYIVYPTGSRPASPSYTAVSAGFYQSCTSGSFASGGPCNGNDQKWQTPGSGSFSNIDLTARVPGNYTLEVFFQITGGDTGGCASTKTDNNGNSPTNYTANFTIQAPLPVSLVAFSAKPVGQQVQIEWATASERDNAFFDVERSADASEFAAIARVEGRGTTASRQTYLVTDETPLKSISYYRLKQTDANGQFSYSPIRDVIRRTNGELLILTQPATNLLQLTGLEESATLEISDLQGRIVYRQATTSPTADIETAAWRSGLYVLRITEPTGVQVRRVIVQH